MKEVDPATAAAAQGYPDKAVLNVTLDQLKAAPQLQICIEHGFRKCECADDGRQIKTTP